MHTLEGWFSNFRFLCLYHVEKDNIFYALTSPTFVTVIQLRNIGISIVSGSNFIAFDGVKDAGKESECSRQLIEPIIGDDDHHQRWNRMYQRQWRPAYFDGH